MTSYRRSYWLCKCSCGKEKWISSNSLKRGDSKSCGCNRGKAISEAAKNKHSSNNILMHFPKRISPIYPRQQGNLKITTEYKIFYSNNGNKKIKYKCECKCGNIVWLSKSNLNTKKSPSQSCGCLIKERIFYNKIHKKEKRIKNEEIALNCLYSTHICHSSKRKLDFDIFKEDFEKIIKKECYYCGKEPSNYISYGKSNKYMYSGLDRIDNTKGYFLDNVVPCCIFCNKAKDTDTQKDFLEWVQRVYKYNKKII